MRGFTVLIHLFFPPAVSYRVVPLSVCWPLSKAEGKMVSFISPCSHRTQVPNPDLTLDHDLYVRGGLSLDLNPECPCVNTTNLIPDPYLELNPVVNYRPNC